MVVAACAIRAPLYRPDVANALCRVRWGQNEFKRGKPVQTHLRSSVDCISDQPQPTLSIAAYSTRRTAMRSRATRWPKLCRGIPPPGLARASAVARHYGLQLYHGGVVHSLSSDRGLDTPPARP